jgi:hypothetical protein
MAGANRYVRGTVEKPGMHKGLSQGWIDRNRGAKNRTKTGMKSIRGTCYVLHVPSSIVRVRRVADGATVTSYVVKTPSGGPSKAVALLIGLTIHTSGR